MTLKSAGLVALLGDVLCDNLKEQNDWKKRMLNTIHGISFPEDFDSLPEKERGERLDKAIALSQED